MTSAVEICNQALAAIGTRSTIASLTENSAEALACAQQFDGTRDKLLRAAPWNFATRWATLGLLKALPGMPESSITTTSSVWLPTYPPPPWAYSYAYPADALMVRSVHAQPNNATTTIPLFSSPYYTTFGVGQAVRFEVMSDLDEDDNMIKVVCANISQALVKYTVKEPPIEMWDISFVEMLSDALASQIAMTLTGNANVVKLMAAKANEAILEARERDGNEGLTIVDHVPDWLQIRGVGGVFSSYDGIGPVAWGPLF